MVDIPNFPECRHPIVAGLTRHTDHELLTLFQRKPESGQYFLAIFCRYSPIVYTLIQHSARSPVQANYLFAMTWRHIYHELRGVELRDFLADPSRSTEKSSAKRQVDGKAGPSIMTLQSWLINITAVCINKAELPPTESVHYAMDKASPPLWCYLEQAINQLSPVHRLVLLLAQTFHWSKPRIAAYLQAEGEALSADQLDHVLEEGYHQLKEALPEDIQSVYLDKLMNPIAVDSTPTA
ncbi:MAG: sigma-70 family RNA polymerase sigma factor [Cyanobacteria bacterium P01_F01_bin.150]